MPRTNLVPKPEGEDAGLKAALEQEYLSASSHTVIPAKAGIQRKTKRMACVCWIPAFAGMTAWEAEANLYK
jgi:hypothetical protein